MRIVSWREPRCMPRFVTAAASLAGSALNHSAAARVQSCRSPGMAPPGLGASVRTSEPWSTANAAFHWQMEGCD